MAYLPKLHPTVGGGLGGLPERTTAGGGDSQTVPVAVSTTPKSLFRVLDLYSAVRSLSVFGEGFIVRCDSVDYGYGGFNKTENVSYYMSITGETRPIGVNLVFKILNNTVILDENGFHQNSGKHYTMQKEWWDGVNDIGKNSGGGRGETQDTISVAPYSGNVNANFLNYTFDDGSYVIQIQIDSTSAYQAYYDTNGTQVFSNRCSNNTSLATPVKFNNGNLLIAGILYSDTGTVLKNRIGVDLPSISGGSSLFDTDAEYAIVGNNIYDFNTLQYKSTSASSLMAEATVYDKLNDLFIENGGTRIYMYRIDRATRLRTNVGYWTLSSQSIGGHSIKALSVRDGYIFAIVYLTSYTDAVQNRSSSLLVLPITYDSTFLINDNLHYIVYSVTNTSTTNDPITFTYTVDTSTYDGSASWTSMPLIAAASISPVTYEYSDHTVTSGTTATVSWWKTKFLNLEGA
jgi:hypothetical protein